MTVDLDQSILINESSDPDVPGDVSLFRSVSDAAQYLEPIDVRNNEYFAYSLDGRELLLRVENNRVRIAHSNASDDHTARIRRLLEAAAGSVITASRRRGNPKAEIDPSQMTTQLIS